MKKHVLIFAAVTATATATAMAGLGCAMLIGLEDTSTITNEGGAPPTPPPTDGGPPPNQEEEEEDLDASTVQPNPEEEGGVLGGDGGPTPFSCPVTTPAAFEPILSGPVSQVCDVNGSLVQGGAFTGLDCHGAGVETIDGWTVTACVAFELGTAKLASATIRLFATDKGCAFGCYGDGCDNTATARVFFGANKNITSWKKGGFAKLGATSANYTFKAPIGDYPVVAICRSGAGPQYEDIAVDGIAATCR